MAGNPKMGMMSFTGSVALYINEENVEALQGFPAGGRKSGSGGAAGKHGLYEFTQTHMVYLQYKLPGAR